MIKEVPLAHAAPYAAGSFNCIGIDDWSAAMKWIGQRQGVILADVAGSVTLSASAERWMCQGPALQGNRA